MVIKVINTNQVVDLNGDGQNSIQQTQKVMDVNLISFLLKIKKYPLFIISKVLISHYK